MRTRLRRTGHSFLALAFCASLATSSIRAQSPEQTLHQDVQRGEILSYEGQNVSSVEIAGRPDLGTEQFRDLFTQHSGEPFSPANVDQTIAALKASGKFQDVTLDLRPEASGIRVIFIAQPAFSFGVYEFQGAHEFTYVRLLQVSNYSSAEPYSAEDLQTAEENLRTFMKRNGFFEAEVASKIQTDESTHLVNVKFSITPNRRADFGEVHIEGPSGEETARLQSSLKSLRAVIFESAIRSGKKYSFKTLQKATTHLENTLLKENRLEARVKLIGAEYHPETNRADITFNVEPGPPVNVKVEGTHLWSWTKQKLLPVYQQAGLESDVIEEGRDNLIKYLTSKGYFSAAVDARVLREESGATVVYEVTKGPRRKVEGTAFTGNQHFSKDELDRHVLVKESRLFSRGKYDENSARMLKTFYQTKGFNQVRVTPEFVAHDGGIVVTFAVEEGPQDTVDSLAIQGNSAVPLQKLAPDGINLGQGRPYSQKAIDDDRNKIMTKYLEMGYLSATFRATAHPSAADDHKFQVTYEISEGPQVHTNTIVTLGRNAAKQTLVDKEAKDLKPGEPLTERDLMTSESRLYTTGVFDWAEVSPRHPITSQPQEDVIIRVHEAKRNSLTYGFGIEYTSLGGTVPNGVVALPGLPPVGLPSTFKTSQRTVFGPRFDFIYARSNVRGRGEVMTLSGLIGPLDRRGMISYLDPNFRQTDWASSASISADYNKENPIFTSRQGLLSYQFKRALNPKRTENLILQYSASQTALLDLLIPALVPERDLHTRLSTLSATWTRDTRDNILDATKGLYDSVELDFNPSVLGSNVNFAKFLAQAAAYRNIHSGIIWANSVRIGLEEASSSSYVPLSQKFFTGGGSTLRGFPLNGAGPQATIPACGNPADPSTCGFITVPTGGPQLLIVNSEFRIPLPIKKGLGFAAFYDGGNVYSRVGFKDFFTNYTNSVGFGLRYATPVGPIRIDIGHNLSGIPGIKATQIFLTLGQAF